MKDYSTRNMLFPLLTSVAME